MHGHGGGELQGGDEAAWACDTFAGDVERRAVIRRGADEGQAERHVDGALEEIAAAYPGRLSLLHGDALALDPAAECAARGLPPPYRIVANLPYNVATPLLLGWLAAIERYESLTLMFQKEVAERLGARPRTKSYGRLAIAAQWRCTVERLFTLPPGAFVPPPKVDSTVVRLVPRAQPLAPADPALLERVTAAAFGQRRKMLRQSLKALGGEALCRAAGIEPTARAEELTVEQFCALARAVGNQSWR